jgi:hypothetical protein
MDIPKGRKAQFPHQIISRISDEMRKDIEDIKGETKATEADILRLALEEFITRYKRAKKKKESNE